MGRYCRDRLRRRRDFNQTGSLGGGGLYRGGASAGSELEPDEVRARFHVHFQNDEVHAGQGVLSTDEATERRRWRKIVYDVLPEIPEPDRAFDELWDHFSRPESWRCFPDVAPALKALTEWAIPLCVGSNFDGRLRGVVQGLPELASLGGLPGHLVGSGFPEAACVVLPGRLRPPGLAARAGALRRRRPRERRAWARSARVSPGLLLDRVAQRPADLPHVPNLTALVQSRFNGD